MVYLDNAATTQPKFFAKDYNDHDCWVNPNSSHKLGIFVQQQLNFETKTIKQSLGVKNGRLFFFQSATQCVQWLTYRFNLIHSDKQIYCSKYEHDSVINCPNVIPISKQVYQQGDLFLYQYVNHITGHIFPIEKLGEAVHKVHGFFGTDMTAAIGHVYIPENIEEFCDALWFSGHKFHIEKGIACLWVGHNLCEYLRISETPSFQGTPDYPAVRALSQGLDKAMETQSSNCSRYKFFCKTIMQKMDKLNIPYRFIRFPQNEQSYAINCMIFENIIGDALVQFLSTKDIYISPGHSACSGAGDYRVLEAFGFDRNTAQRTVRISFSEDNSFNHIDQFIDAVNEYYNMFGG